MASVSEQRVDGCPLCRRLGNDLLYRGRTPVPYFRCRSCHLAYQATRHAAFDAKLYEYYTSRLSLSRSELHDPLVLKRLRGVLGELRELSPGTRLLDVGCGQGGLLTSAIEAGWDAQGIDLAPGAVQLCQAHGLPCRELDFFSDELPKQGFDLITMIEFIEHVVDPGRAVHRAFELLKPGGVLYLTTPNAASLDARVQREHWSVFHIEHLTLFNPRNLTRLLTGRGEFKLLRLQTVNVQAATLRKLLLFGDAVPAPSSWRQATVGGEKAFRDGIEASAWLRRLKAGTNFLLTQSGLGNAMKLTCRRL